MNAITATDIRIQESALDPAAAVMNQRHPAGEPILFAVNQGQTLRIVDLEGNQAADVIFYNRDDLAEHYSATDTMLHQGGIYLTTGSVIRSNEARPMLTIVADTCGRHDFTLTPCSKDTFSIIYGETEGRPGCEGNLVEALAPWGIGVDRIPIAFNVFMHVAVDADSGEIRVLPPRSGPGDFVRLRARMPLVVGMTACSAGQSNNFRYKPIDYRVVRAAGV